MQAEAEDLSRARSVVAEAVERAREAWIPGNSIASALALELQTCLATSDDPEEVAKLLRQIASSIDQQFAKAPATTRPDVTRH